MRDFNRVMLVIIIITGIPYSVVASLSPADSEQLTEDLQNLSYGWNQSTVDSANAILGNSSYNSSDWDEFFYGYFTDNPFTDYLNYYYLQYPILVWQNLTEVQEGMVPALLNRSSEIMNTSMSNLSSQLVNDNETLFNMHRFVDVIAVSGNVSNSTKNSTIYAFYKDEINTRGWLKSNETINNSEYPYLAALRAQMYMSFVDTLPLTNQTKDDIAQTLNLTGRYLDIWNNFSVLVHDNNEFDSVQLNVIYDLFDLIPLEYHDLRGITLTDEGGLDADGLIFESKSKVNIFSPAVGSETEDSFPSDAPASGWVDGFTITLVHEVNHNVDYNYIGKNITIYTQTPEQNVTFLQRKQDLVDTAGTFHMNYLRSTISDGYFYNNPQEFFASISNQWFANASNTLMHGITRFRNGYKDPLNQFLFFAEVYSRGENYTLFYNSDTQGNITKSIVPVTRDAYSHINSLIVEGVQWKFTMDEQGNVIMLVTSPLEGEVTSPIPNLKVFTRELSNIWYPWDSEGNISGCRNCTAYNTTYGEYANTSEQNFVLAMHFNENLSNTTFDDSGNSNDGTRGNATAGTQPTWTTGRFGYGLDFDGTDTFVNVSDSQSLDLNGSFTLTAWIYSRNSTDEQEIIFKLDDSPTWHGYHLDLKSDADSMKLRCMSHNKTGASDHGTITSNDSLTINEWHFVACVRDTSAGQMKLYVDGAEAANPTTDNSLNKDITNNNPLFIGAREGGTWIFNGTIDEVAIYDRVLSVEEIQMHYNKSLEDGSRNVTVYANDSVGNFASYTRYFTVYTTPSNINITSPPNDTISDTTPDLNFTVNETANVTYNWDGEGNISGCRNCTSYDTTYGENNGSDPSTVLLMHFNENYSTTAYDDASNNDGVISGATWTTGKFGPALYSDGSSGYVQVADDASIDFNASTDSFTITAWINSIGATGTGQYIANKQIGLGLNPGYHLILKNSGALRFMIHTTPSNYGDIQGTTNLIGTGWHHVAAVYNASADTMDIYVDGSNDSATASYTPTASSLNNEPLVIGAYNAASGKYVNGTIDEVVFYNRSLIQSEIQGLYNKTLSATQHSVTVYATDADGNQDSATRYFTIG